MKWILSFFGIVAICCSVAFMRVENKNQEDYVRIHIIANSNENLDQVVKYKVKDAVLDFLHKDLEKVDSYFAAKKIISNKLDFISHEVENVLCENMCNYSCDVKLRKELIPARAYSGLTLESGEYETLVITLGRGAGDNWWCCLFPDVCF